MEENLYIERELHNWIYPFVEGLIVFEERSHGGGKIIGGAVYSENFSVRRDKLTLPFYLLCHRSSRSRLLKIIRWGSVFSFLCKLGMKNNSKLTVNPVSSAFELRANNEIQCKSTMRGMYLPPTATVGIVDGINIGRARLWSHFLSTDNDYYARSFR